MTKKVERLNVKTVGPQDRDTVGTFTYNGNTYKMNYTPQGHDYRLAVARGDIDWVPIEKESKAYSTLESVVPEAVKVELNEPSVILKLLNKIKQTQVKQFGGNMNYTYLFQKGGAAPEVSENEIIQLVQAAVSGDQKAAQVLEQLMQTNPEVEGLVQQVVQSMQQLGTQSMKCGGKANKKQSKNMAIKTKKAKCGCMLKKVGGTLIEVDGCTGLPIHRNGNAILKYYIGGNFIRGFGDWIGTKTGKVAEWTQAGLGRAQQNIGEAVQAVTGGKHGGNWVNKGQEKIDNAAATGARINSAIDAGAQRAGNAYDAVERGVRTFVPGIGWALNAADSYLDKKIGNYDATTGNIVKADGTATELVRPIYENQRTARNEQLGYDPDAETPAAETPATPQGKVNMLPVDPAIKQAHTISNIKPDLKRPVEEKPVDGRYAAYGMQYTKDGEGNVVEDWKNTQNDNRSIARAAIADNMASYRENRNAIRNSGMSFAQQEAALREQRAARRQANQDARTWRREQQGAYDQARMADLSTKMTGYNKNGGRMSYADYLR